MSKIKTCPFCGSEGLVSTCSNIYSDVYLVACSGEHDSGCVALSLNGFCDSEKEAIEEWNKREGAEHEQD